MLWPRGHPGISSPESLRGLESLRALPSVSPATHLQQVPVGFHRFEPVECNGVATAPGNVTYPTRNFATLGPFYCYTNTHMWRVCGVMHCALLLHVAMQIGLSHLSEKRAWRIVSEDSGARRPFLLIVRTPWIVTAVCAASTRGFSEFPAYSQVYLRNYNVWSLIKHHQDTLRAQLFPLYLYSYGRRLPGLRSGASPCG